MHHSTTVKRPRAKILGIKLHLGTDVTHFGMYIFLQTQAFPVKEGDFLVHLVQQRGMVSKGFATKMMILHIQVSIYQGSLV